MRKLVVAVVAILALFTFIREYDAGTPELGAVRAQAALDATGLD